MESKAPADALEPSGRVPPADINAEAATLSSAMLDPKAMPRLIDLLAPEHFFSESHRRIYEACVELFRANKAIDLQTVASWLHARSRLEQVGGSTYIVQVANSAPVVHNVREYAVAVHDAWRKRQVILVCQKIAARAYGDVGDVQEWIDEGTRAFATIGTWNPVRPVETNDQALTRILEECFNLDGPKDGAPAQRSLSGFPLGLYHLDELLGGLHKGAKTTIVALSGVGKSAIAIHAAVRLAKQGVGVLFFSTEMKRIQVLRRALAAESGVSAEKIKRPKSLTTVDRYELVEAAKRLRLLPLIIDETPHISIDEIAAVAKKTAEHMKLVLRVPLGMIVGDSVQRFAPPRGMAQRERHHQLAHTTKMFKTLAAELDVVGLELAQGKPKDTRGKTEWPSKYDIAESSHVTKESDDIIFLEGLNDPDSPRQDLMAHVLKQREGRKGKVPLTFVRDLYRFEDPNEPNLNANPSRQYVDPHPPGAFDDLR